MMSRWTPLIVQDEDAADRALVHAARGRLDGLVRVDQEHLADADPCPVDTTYFLSETFSSVLPGTSLGSTGRSVARSPSDTIPRSSCGGTSPL